MFLNFKRKVFKSKRMFASIMTLIFTFILISPVASNATTLKVTNKYNKLSYLTFPDGKERVFFPMKVIVGTNELVYCLEHAKLTPDGEEYTGSGYLDGGIRYILAQNPKTGDINKDYYIKQAAVHYYLGQFPEVNQAKDSAVKRAIINMSNEAKEHKNDPETPGLTMSDSIVNFKYFSEKDTYETDWINLKTSGDVSKFKSTLSKTPEGMEIVLPGGKVVSNLGKNDTKFFLRIARDKVKNDFTMEMRVRAIFKVTKVQEFVPQNSKYQKIAYPKVVEVAGKDEAILKASLKKVYGSLEVIKKGDDGKLLEGAKFSLYKEDGKTKIASGTTDKNGRLLFTNLEQETYILREDEAPEGYVITVKDTPVKVVVDKKNEVDIENQKIKGRIQITKVDEETGIKLEGAEFDIKDKTTGKVLEKVTTNKEGKALSSYYPYGTQIVVQEVKAPNKYVLNGKEYFATITENMKTIEITVPNKIIKGTISIHKIDKDTNKPLAGVEFDVVDSDNNVVEHVVTDKDGNAKTKELNYGNYKFIETKGLEGYILNNTPVEVNITENKDYGFTVDNQIIKGRIQITKVDEETGTKLEGAEFEIKDKATGKVLEKVTTNKDGLALSSYYNYGTQIVVQEVKAPNKYVLNEKEYFATITENMKTIEITVPNRIIKGTISIHKVDKDTKKPLEGVEFNILDSNDKIVETLTTDKDGNAKSKELNYGDYTFVETKGVDGYLLNNTPIKVSIIENKDYSFTIDNQIIKGRIQIAKVDEETGTKLEGAEFEIKDKATGKVLEKVTTNKDGLALSSYYNYGTQIVVKEVKAPAKYTLNGEEFFATITENMKTIEITVPNKIIKGTIFIHKVDKDTKKPLEGVEFNILDSNDKVVETLTTDKDGNAKSKELNYGEYKVVEVKTNKYYNLNTDFIKVNIVENTDYKYTVENAPITGKLLIKKVDIATNEELAGAKIKITCIEGLDKGKVIEFVSEKTAKEFDLKAGVYTYEETQAPEGYEINKEVGKFEITEQGQIVKCSVKDKAIEKPVVKVELPKTGYEGAILIGIGILVVISGAIIIFGKKKNKSDNK